MTLIASEEKGYDGFTLIFPQFRFTGKILKFPEDTEPHTIKRDSDGQYKDWLVKKTEDTMFTPSNYYKMKGLKIYNRAGEHVDTLQLESRNMSVDEMKLIFKYHMN